MQLRGYTGYSRFNGQCGHLHATQDEAGDCARKRWGRDGSPVGVEEDGYLVSIDSVYLGDQFIKGSGLMPCFPGGYIKSPGGSGGVKFRRSE
jgi:hypothetical protein